MSFVVRKRNRLPHWDVSHGIQFVTWHLADALPAEVLERLRRERDYQRQRLRETRESVTKADVATLEVAFRRRCEVVLDQSHGECMLRDPRAAKIVADAITHFDEQRYRLFAWSVMPNHVHAIFSTQLSLAELLHSWKSYTRTMINRELGRTGKLWQDDYFDRLVRNEKQFRQAVDYVVNNPVKAGACRLAVCRLVP